MADLSKEYAAALFSLANEKDLLSKIKLELEKIKCVISENEDYLLILRSPALGLNSRLNLIDDAFGGNHEYVVSFLKLLLENGHIASLPECIDEFFTLCKALENRQVAKIYYVKEPTDAQKQRLLDKLEAKTNKKIDAIYIEDKTLIGGIKVKLEDLVIDGSLTSRLSNIKGVIG